jgi:signal transduction histidine kinase
LNSLRARIALFLVLSNFCVILLATFVTVIVLGWLDPTGFYDRLATQIVAIDRLTPGIDASRIQEPLAITPLAGEPRTRMTEQLQAALRRRNSTINVVVTEPVGAPRPFASVALPGIGWFSLPVPDEPPSRRVLLTLFGWIGLALIGTGAVALVVAHRITLPLAMLERIATSVGPDGGLPPLAENGPAEVRATARALNRLATSLRSAVESRMRLVAAAGHDLRTPLTRMRLRAEFLKEEERPKWLRDLDELERIADSAIRLVREEIEGHADEPVRLDALVEQICEELEAMEMPVRLRATEPTTVASAPMALMRALRNLIINAASHGGGARVSSERQGNQALVVIEDDGPGIPDDVLDRVFEPFFRVDPARRQAIPGAGLGLAIAKEIIDRQGGSIVLFNRAEGGLRQEIRFAIVRDAA